MSGDEKYLDQPCYKKWLARNELGWSNSLKATIHSINNTYYE